MVSMLRCWEGKSRDHGLPELHLDYASIVREVENRASPILVGRFSKYRWLITHPLLSDQEVSIVGVEGLTVMPWETVMPEESPVGAGAESPVIERKRVGDAAHHEVYNCIRLVGAQHHI